MAVEVVFGEDVGDAVVGTVFKHQAAQQGLFGFYGMGREGDVADFCVVIWDGGFWHG